MLEYINEVFRAYSSRPPCSGNCEFQLSADELPQEWQSANTCFAMFANKYCPSASLVILAGGECGLKCTLENSVWYLFEDEKRGLPSHKVTTEIDYIFKNGWRKQ